jgi:linoleoyl-CoA desaturase
LLLGVICGLCTVLLVFNVAHDAAHHALSPQRWVNQWLSYTFNLVGGNGYMWDITHNKIHHAYPNVADLDTDIHQQAPLIRVSPSVPLRPFHRYQHLYAPLLYASYSLFLAFLKDYQDFGLLPKRDSQLLPRRHPWREYLVLFGSKAFYLGYSLLLPLIILEFSWVQILGGFFLVHALMSLSLAVVLIPVHMVDEAPFAEVAPDGTLSHDWTLHVFANTTDYARNSRWANLFFGGLNTHLVHHLFPGVCHAHYIPLSEIIKQTAAECGLTYREVSMGQAIASHFRLLKRMGRPEQT